MLDPSFIHLRTHTAYSLSEGAIKLPKLVDLCVEHAMPAVAITDTNNLFGALEFALAASKAGIQPVIGCQMDVAREGDAARKARLGHCDDVVCSMRLRFPDAVYCTWTTVSRK